MTVPYAGRIEYLTPNGVCGVANRFCDIADAIYDVANGRGASQKIYEKTSARQIFFSYAATAKFGLFPPQAPFATPQTPFATTQMPLAKIDEVKY